MVEAPERIWAEYDPETHEKRWYGITGMGTEYVRADRLEALERENAELRAKLDMQRESKEYAQRCCIAAETRLGEATTCAEKLAVTLHQKHYLADAREWRVLSGDLVGVLTQIDNMTSGLVRAEAAMELAGKLNAAEATIARLSEALTECALLSGLDNELIEGASVIVTSRMAEIHQHASAALAVSGGGWRTIETAPTGWHNYFFIRPAGLHPATGKRFLPTIVQQIDGQFYAPDNELDPIYFGQNEPLDSPLKSELEWRPIPADWIAAAPAVEVTK